MKFLLRFSRILTIATIFLSLALALSFLRPVLRYVRKGQGKDRIVALHLRGICRVMGIKIHLRGDAFPDANFLLLANHLSYLDIIILGSLAPMSFMAKSEIRTWPIIGFLAKRGSAVFVGRHSVSERLKALHESRRLLRKESLCIFPEGTTSAARSPNPAQWYRGNIALERDHPLLCAGLYYQDQAVLAWIDDQELLPHLYRVLALRRIDVFIETSRLQSQASLSLKEMSQLAHRRICHLTDSAFEQCRHSLTQNLPRDLEVDLNADSLYQIR